LVTQSNLPDFVQGLNVELGRQQFGRFYADEGALEEHVAEVILKYSGAKAYGGTVKLAAAHAGSYQHTVGVSKLRKSSWVDGFGWSARPDMTVDVGVEGRIALEIKISNYDLKRSLIKSGIGQAVLYRAAYDAVFLFVLYRGDETLDKEKHAHDEKVKKLLWDNCGIGVIVHEQE